MSGDKLISRKKVIELTGISKGTILRLESQGLFPPSMRIGHRTVRYSEAEIFAWIAERKITGRSAGYDAFVARREREAAETAKMLADAALATKQLELLAHAPRYKRRCSCGSAE